jgi:hypothetical protein
MLHKFNIKPHDQNKKGNKMKTLKEMISETINTNQTITESLGAGLPEFCRKLAVGTITASDFEERLSHIIIEAAWRIDLDDEIDGSEYNEIVNALRSGITVKIKIFE